MFDLLIWLFGGPVAYGVQLHEPRRMAGFLELEQARVAWFLSVDDRDLPDAQREKGKRTLRSIQIDGTAIDFSSGFENLHTRVYQQTLAGRGLGIEDARPSIELAHRIRQASLASRGPLTHPFLR
jgi:UDP-N-acetyl-2-amino-2-deoxyglucuronate dehydrogenase